jgi:hypothetical protein
MKTKFAASFSETLMHFSALLARSEKHTQKADFKGMQLFLKGRNQFLSSLG